MLCGGNPRQRSLWLFGATVTLGGAVHLCYVDESGSSGMLTLADPTQEPVFIVAALLVDRVRLLPLTNEFLRLKQRFYRAANTVQYLDLIQNVTKGSTIRDALRRGNRRNVTHAIGFLDGVVGILENHQVRLLAKGLVKGLGVQNSDQGFYGAAIMHVCEHFQSFLVMNGSEHGQIIADSRKTAQNWRTSHTVFTQMFRIQGNSYPNLTEMPTFGYPHNHAMIQLADITCSAILFPMIVDAYCADLANAHVSPRYATVRGRYRDTIQTMQYRYQNGAHAWRGGVYVTDGTGQGRTASYLFR